MPNRQTGHMQGRWAQLTTVTRAVIDLTFKKCYSTKENTVGKHKHEHIHTYIHTYVCKIFNRL